MADIDQSLLDFLYFLSAVGGIVVLVVLGKLLWVIIQAIMPAKDIAERYGEDSWVIVTGGSDGIGLGFC